MSGNRFRLSIHVQVAEQYCKLACRHIGCICGLRPIPKSIGEKHVSFRLGLRRLAGTVWCSCCGFLLGSKHHWTTGFWHDALEASVTVGQLLLAFELTIA